jgi:hypothetical protein
MCVRSGAKATPLPSIEDHETHRERDGVVCSRQTTSGDLTLRGQNEALSVRKVVD